MALYIYIMLAKICVTGGSYEFNTTATYFSVMWEASGLMCGVTLFFYTYCMMLAQFSACADDLGDDSRSSMWWHLLAVAPMTKLYDGEVLLICNAGLSIIGGILSLQEDGSESSVNTFLCVMCCCTVLPLALWLVMAFLLFVLSLPSMIALSIPMIICNFLVPLGICFGVVLICYPCIMGGAVLTSKDGGAAGSANFMTGMAAETLGPVVALFFQVVLCPSLFWYAGGISLWGDGFTSFWENNDFCFRTNENGNPCFPGVPEFEVWNAQLSNLNRSEIPRRAPRAPPPLAWAWVCPPFPPAQNSPFPPFFFKVFRTKGHRGKGKNLPNFQKNMAPFQKRAMEGGGGDPFIPPLFSPPS
eukprot:FR735638.1.p1 GENE.FR735638.1~~FR735638.1.p1  ORF type:complete len:395 (+),score=91.83 FR735638.1:114-1187(+)